MNMKFVLKCIEDTEEILDNILNGGDVGNLVVEGRAELEKAHAELMGFTVDGYDPNGEDINSDG